MRVFSETNYQFIDWRRKAFVLSGVLIVVSLASLLIKGGPKYSIDFTGGTLVQLNFEKPISVEEAREALSGVVGLTNYDLQGFGDETTVIFRTAELEEEELEVVLEERLRTAFPDNPFTRDRTESVGPKIGEELKEKAVLAILYSMVGILIYITIRFEFRFGIAAVIALFHDVVITLGAFSLSERELSLAVIAAFLTIVGYSLNDTIVIFDRIREGLSLWRKEPYEKILNRSINQTLSRTVITSGTSLFVVLCLYVLGGEVLRDFAFALLIGVVTGTYSSVFVASPVLVEWYQRSSEKKG
jgi:preprotein translocase SecF subunit